jgi:hypothetical protein
MALLFGRAVVAEQCLLFAARKNRFSPTSVRNAIEERSA